MSFIRPFSGKHAMQRIVIMTAAAVMFFIAGPAAEFPGGVAQGAENEPGAITEKKAAPEPGPAEDPWPRVMEGKTVTLVAHQPQLDNWDFNVIEFRMAVEITQQGKKEPFYGGSGSRGTRTSAQMTALCGSGTSRYRRPNCGNKAGGTPRAGEKN